LAEEPSIRAIGLKRERLLPLLLEWGEFEFRQEMEGLLPLVTDQAEQSKNLKAHLAMSALRSRRFEEACKIAADDIDPAFQLLIMGRAACLQGDWETSLKHFEAAVQASSEPVYAACVAKNLMWLGRIQEAREACPSNDEQFTMLIRAGLAETPEECLALCERIEAAGPDLYFELAERRGLAYHQLGRFHFRAPLNFLRTLVVAGVRRRPERRSRQNR